MEREAGRRLGVSDTLLKLHGAGGARSDGLISMTIPSGGGIMHAVLLA